MGRVGHVVRVFLILGNNMTKIVTFFKEVRQELTKVTWPGFHEFIGATIVVLIIMAFFSVYLGAVDFSLRLLSEFVFSL